MRGRPRLLSRPGLSGTGSVCGTAAYGRADPRPIIIRVRAQAPPLRSAGASNHHKPMGPATALSRVGKRVFQRELRFGETAAWRSFFSGWHFLNVRLTSICDIPRPSRPAQERSVWDGRPNGSKRRPQGPMDAQLPITRRTSLMFLDERWDCSPDPRSHDCRSWAR